jgi:ubiquinone/menaquinone biosynthesis C-methylase UbiE
MSCEVCPWWLGYLLAAPWRKLWHDPRAILRPFLAEGMTVLEPGPGMGFFTLDVARLVGPTGRVVAVDIQPRMLEALRRRARKAGLLERIDARLARGDGMGIDDIDGRVDFVLAFAVVHELPNAGRFFAEARRALKPGGQLLLSEPRMHVSEEAFGATLEVARDAGFEAQDRIEIPLTRSVIVTAR